MGAGYIFIPIVLIVFFIIPIILFFLYKKSRNRIVFLSIPFIITISFFLYVSIDSYKKEKLHEEFPQINKIVFKNSTEELKDSIYQLEILMRKLPENGVGGVSYSLDKHNSRYNILSFYGSKIERLDLLREFYCSNRSDQQLLKKIENNSFYPISTLTLTEAKRLIQLIEFLDNNSLNAMEVGRDITNFRYIDSLSIAHNLGGRTITMDTTKYYNSTFFYVHDVKDGFYLLSKL
jgi:hypothetical protein